MSGKSKVTMSGESRVATADVERPPLPEGPLELTTGEIDFLLQVLDSVSITGPEAMRACIAVHDKLKRARASLVPSTA